MKITNTFPRIGALTGLAFMTCLGVHSLQAADYYWDSNGTTAGAGTNPTGTWGTDAYWSTSSAGTAATANTLTTGTDNLLFSAGSDTTGAYTVTLNGVQNAKTITGRTGHLTLTSGTLAMGTNGVGGADYLRTTGSANLTIDSAILVNNDSGTNNYFAVDPATGTTLTLNGTVSAVNGVSGNSNRIFLRVGNGAGTIVFNSDLGADDNFRQNLALGGSDGMTTGGTMTFKGNQNLTGVRFVASSTSRRGTVNFGETVNTSNAVTVGRLEINSGAGDMTGTIYNINSAVTSGTAQMIIKNGGVVNVAGSLTTTGATFLGINNAGSGGGEINVLNGGTASLGTLQVSDGLVFKNGGTVTGSTLTLGHTDDSSGTFQVGDATGTGTATFTSLATSGAGTANRITGGNSSISTFTLNNSSAVSYSGMIGGGGSNENNVALTKNGGGTLTLSGQNTYVGNTTVNAGTLILADNAQLAFVIGASGVNNGIGGTGTLTLNGDFTLDLTTAGTGLGNSWTIVNVGTLTETFGSTFSVLGGWTESSNVWSKINGGITYEFAEATGVLQVTAIPEPSTALLLFGAASALVLIRRRR